jgi:two-component system, chemotaxis family, protein-glutamate methylesterase/glutaminase
MGDSRVRVLVVDDSKVYRTLLTDILNSDPAIEVIGVANDGLEALEKAVLLKPDLITIDVHMPRLGGFEATGRIMQEYPVPIVIVTGYLKTAEVSMTFDALKAGAVAIIPKPEGPGSAGFEESSRKFIRMIKLMSEIKVVRKYKVNGNSARTADESPNQKQVLSDGDRGMPEVIVIGASAGGPPVLLEILNKMSDPFPIPLVIVQHVDAGFADAMCEWLRHSTKREIRIASQGEKLCANNIYFAPGDHHIGFLPDARIDLSKGPLEHSCRPSVSYLFRSAWCVFGKNALGILLTGMGRDGALELKELRDAGSLTIAQDESSSLVHGMPGEAVRLGAATHILPPDQIVDLLNKLLIR